MYNITEQGNSIQITDGTTIYLFPKGVLSAIAHKGDNQTVDIRLMASRKNILTFRYDNCNLAQDDAEKTAIEIGKIM